LEEPQPKDEGEVSLMQEEIEYLKKQIEDLKEALKHKAGENMPAYYFEPLKRDLAALESRVDRILDATITAITTGSVEGLKSLKR
jgi:Tfp pilus assembly protein PilO